MIRSILAALFSFVLGNSALAQSCSVPNTLTNGTNADANQVMANLNAILACVNNQAAPRGYLSGLTLSTAGGSASFGIAAGVATSDDATTSMKLAASSTKSTGAWAAGSANGSLDTGSIANNTWYHVFLIERTDTAAVDVLISQSPTSPTLPTSYTKKRRIGSMKTNGSFQWIKFSQLGDEFLWDTAVTDASNVAIADTVAHLLTLTVPTGVQIWALFHGQAIGATNSDGRMYWSSPDKVDEAAGGGLATAGEGILSGLQTATSFALTIRTNASAQVRYRAFAASGSFYAATGGWIDRRGRDF